MIIAIQSFYLFRQTLLTFLARFLRPYHFNILLNYKSIKDDEEESDDEDIQVQVYADTDEEKGVVFSPPVYVQRYAAVTDCLMESKWQGGIQKVVELGYHDKSFIKYLQEIPGVKTILGVDIEDAALHSSLDQYDEIFSENKNTTHITLFQGNAADPDYRLIGSDAVVAIEMIEHMLPHDLERLVHNVFGFIKPHIAIFTTPNADFNELFKSLEKNGLRRMDHFFEWTRVQFNEWCANIVSRYPTYKVSCRGIGPGPPGTRHLGCCSQMAVFESTNYQKQQDLTPNSLTLLNDVPEQNFTNLIGECDSIDNIVSEKSMSLLSNQPMSITRILYKPCSDMTLPLYYEGTYSLDTNAFCDQTSQCNIELEIARSFLMFDECDEKNSTILVPRLQVYDKIYDIEDLISRLNCTTHVVTKFSKFAQKLMKKYKKQRHNISTRKIVAAIKNVSEMLEVKRECTSERIWSNFIWGMNAPYWNNYYKIVWCNYYPRNPESQDNFILDQIIIEVNRCIDEQFSDNKDRLYIPLTRLMNVVSHLTKDVEKVKELLEWNGYVIENDAVLYTYNLDTDKDLSLWTNMTYDVLSTDYPETMQLSSDSNGFTLHHCIYQKLQNLRHISYNDAAVDNEIDKVLKRLTKLAIRSNCCETALTPQWMQRKLYELLSLTERAIETRRLHFIENYTLSENKEHNDERPQSILEKYKEADNKISEIEMKYKHLVKDCFVSNNVVVETSEITNIHTTQKSELKDVSESKTDETKSSLDQINDELSIEKSENDNQCNVLKTMKLYQNCLMKYAKLKSNNNKKKTMKLTKTNPRRLIMKDSPKKTFLCNSSMTKTGRYGQKPKDKTTWGRRYSSALSCKPIPESLIKLCHPELCSGKYVKNIWLNDTVYSSEQSSYKNETILETEESQLISIVMDDADESTSLQCTAVIDEDTTIEETDYKISPSFNKLTSMCFYKKATADSQSPEAMFLNDNVNEPSTSKGLRHMNMDVQCGSDNVIPSDSKDNLSEHIQIGQNNKELGTPKDDSIENTNPTVPWNKMHAGIYIKDSITNADKESEIVNNVQYFNNDENENSCCYSIDTVENDTVINNSNFIESNEIKPKVQDNLVERKQTDISRKPVSDETNIKSCKDSEISHDINTKGTWKDRAKTGKKKLNEFRKENIPHNQINTVMHVTPITDQVSLKSSVKAKTSHLSKRYSEKNNLLSSKSPKMSKISKSSKTVNQILKETQVIKNHHILPKLSPTNKQDFNTKENFDSNVSNIEIGPNKEVDGITDKISMNIDSLKTDLQDTTKEKNDQKAESVTKSNKKQFNRVISNSRMSKQNTEIATNIKQKDTKPITRIDKKKSREVNKGKTSIKMRPQNIKNDLMKHDDKTELNLNCSSEIPKEKLENSQVVSNISDQSKIKVKHSRLHSALPTKKNTKTTVENLCPQRNPKQKEISSLKRANSVIEKYVSIPQTQNLASEKKTLIKSNTQDSINFKRSNSKHLIQVTVEEKHEKIIFKIPPLNLNNKQDKFISDLAKIQNIMRDDHEKLKLLKNALTHSITEETIAKKHSKEKFNRPTQNTGNTSSDFDETILSISQPPVIGYDNSQKTKLEVFDLKDAQSNFEGNIEMIKNGVVHPQPESKEVRDVPNKSEHQIISLITSNTDTVIDNKETSDTILDIEKSEPKVLFTERSNTEKSLHRNKRAKSHIEIKKWLNMKSRKYLHIRSSLFAQTEKPSFSVTQKRLKKYKSNSLKGFVSKNLKSKVRLTRSKVEELQKDLVDMKLFDNERNYMIFCNEIKSKSSDIDCVTPKNSKLENKNEDGKIKKLQCSSSTCSTSNSVITVKSFGSFETKPLSDSSFTPSHQKLITGNTPNSTKLTKHKSKKCKFSKCISDKLQTTPSRKMMSNKKDTEKVKHFKGKGRNIITQCFNSDSSALQSPSHNKNTNKIPSSSIKKRKSLEFNVSVNQKTKSPSDILSENVINSNILGLKRPLDCTSDSCTDIPSPKREKIKSSTSLKPESNDINKNDQSAGKIAGNPDHTSHDVSSNECVAPSNKASLDNFVVEVFTALENLIADEIKPSDKVIMGNANEEVQKEKQLNEDIIIKKDDSICETIKKTEIKDIAMTPTDTDCWSYRSITSVSIYSDAYLADNELTSLGTVKANISSITELYERSDQFTVQTANGQTPFQGFSGYSIGMAPVTSDLPDYCNSVDSETGSVAATRTRQATSVEVLGGAISSESFASCIVDDDSVVPDWLFAIMTQHHEVDASSDATRASEDIPEERLMDVNGNLDTRVGLESGAGDGRGMHSQPDSSGQGMSIDSSGSSSPPQSTTIIIDPSNFTAQFGTLLDSINSTDRSVENTEYEDAESLMIQGHHVSPGVHSLSADADVSSTGTEGSSLNPTQNTDNRPEE